MSATLSRAAELDLGGKALIAAVCREHRKPLVTLDARHRLALAIGARSTYLLA